MHNHAAIASYMTPFLAIGIASGDFFVAPKAMRYGMLEQPKDYEGAVGCLVWKEFL